MFRKEILHDGTAQVFAYLLRWLAEKEETRTKAIDQAGWLKNSLISTFVMRSSANSNSSVQS
jgi:hypothetical protein